ncbi:DUF7671 family protein [Levilactobacillus suantsaiihabitans]|uniref:DUF7671 domain-containing protein n=1 Tax=Levilactobacillus suantsaiihabitans TaxID=2487722 RepID=A0A4Z0JC62_9LACO|nr:hypothetical protein [Levilactobacillus suantsaiihabitans]TGD20316.1 hypothetical protein EGT51_00775 [Levilactobacillus suantsaiihabitans]
MKAKYDVNVYSGVPVETNASGQYEIKRDPDGSFKLHDWRTGRHSKGKFKGVGQIFLTENNLRVAVIVARPLDYKQRHDYTPMQRLTSEFVSDDLVQTVRQALASDD